MGPCCLCMLFGRSGQNVRIYNKHINIDGISCICVVIGGVNVFHKYIYFMHFTICLINLYLLYLLFYLIYIIGKIIMNNTTCIMPTIINYWFILIIIFILTNLTLNISFHFLYKYNYSFFKNSVYIVFLQKYYTLLLVMNNELYIYVKNIYYSMF